MVPSFFLAPILAVIDRVSNSFSVFALFLIQVNLPYPAPLKKRW